MSKSLTLLKLLLLTVGCLFLAPVSALADGAFIPPTAFAKVQIPDQRALIHYANGVETLVIDTSFKGVGTNFAWVIPVPAAPEIEAATTGLFPSLQQIFHPQVVHYVFGYYWLAIGLGVFVLSIIWKVRQGKSVLALLLIWLLLLILSGLFLPAVSHASAGSGITAGTVQVLDRKTVGVYDTATLSSRDGKALLDWLGTNGFVTPTNLMRAIYAYAQEGWFFVASKIRLEASQETPAQPHPLALKFKTGRPVYPLRLTGIGNDSCKIDLYVFGHSRAEVSQFKVQQCAQPDYALEKVSPWKRQLDKLRIRHPLLRKLVQPSPVATKLTAQLSSPQMKGDAYVTWTPFHEQRLKLYSRHAAVVIATNCTVPLLALALLMTYSTRGNEKVWERRLRNISAITASFAVVGWLAIYLALPTIPVVVAKMPAWRTARLHENYIPKMLEWQRNEALSNSTAQVKIDADWVRQQLTNLSFRKELSQFVPGAQTNLFTGAALHEQDSPGNYTVRETPEGIDYLWYDIDGGENVVPLFRPGKKL